MKAKLFLLFFGLLGMVVQAAAKEKIYVNSEVTTQQYQVEERHLPVWDSDRLWTAASEGYHYQYSGR